MRYGETFHERKAWRTKWYMDHVHGYKLRECGACNGSGYYDHNGSPECSSCDGTGKRRYKPVAARAEQESSNEA